MKRQISLVLLILLSSFMSGAHAEENWYFLVDPELREVYEHFEGQSLKDAIDSLIKKKPEGRKSGNNVMVRFKSSFANRLYIGRRGTLEILVKNDIPLRECQLGFEFSCTKGTYNWVANYGSITPDGSPIPNALKIHPEAFGGDSTWVPIARSYGHLDSLSIGGYYLPSLPFLPRHDSEVVLYSMAIDIPYDTSMIGDQFSIDNIVMPLSDHWVFIDSAGHSIVPDFQGKRNASLTKPTAPPVNFKITVDIRCQSDLDLLRSKSGDLLKPKSGKEALRSDYDFLLQMDRNLNNSQKKRITDYDEYYGLKTRNGIKMISVRIRYDGNIIEDLTKLGVEIAFGPEGYDLRAYILLNMLPRVCQLEGVRYINRAVRIYPIGTQGN